MNSISYSWLQSKSVLTLVIALFQLPVFATDYYSTGNGPFDVNTTWSTSPTKNITPLNVDFISGKNNFQIRNGDAVTLSSAISVYNLTIIGTVIRGTVVTSSVALSTSVKIKINGNLNISDGLFDFGTASVSVSVTGNLIGTTNSSIRKSPAIGFTQRLTLNGPENSIEFYIANSGARAGTSEVVYSSNSEQKMFGKTTSSDNAYSTLTVSGTGKKILSENITVAQSLSISGTYVQLDNSSINYAGTEDNLFVTDGWVYTNDRGVYLNSNTSTTETTKTFPVGNAKGSQKVTLTDINTSKGSPEIQMQFKDNGGPAFTSGMGSWYFFTDKTAQFAATFSPSPGYNITERSSIAFYNIVTKNWEVKPTTYTTRTNSYSTTTQSFTLDVGNTWLILYNCPTHSITPTSIAPGFVDEKYVSAPFSVSSSDRSATSLDNLTITPESPTTFNKNFEFASGVLTSRSILTTAQKVPFTLNYRDDIGCSLTEPQPYTLVINNRLSPNLSMLNIDAKTFNSDSFQVRTFSRSTGAITYSISSAGNFSCASINDTTGFVKITCAGPSPYNQITVTATQEAQGLYKRESVSKSFVINPSEGRLYIKNFAFLQSKKTSIKIATKSTGAAFTFEQQSGFDVATVDGFGNVETYQKTGPFTIHISLAATNNYTAFDSIYTFNVYSLQKPPVAIGDTITLEMGNDSTFNILQNDRGQTGEIVTNKTDIDMENRGQQVKYYATELGNFVIDPDGNLTIIPFYGFIGSGKIGYTVTDLNGITSDVAYVQVTIKPPYVIPELKANNIMTPNNDNLNDALVIANTDLSKENSLMILDETGNAVYETTNYQNNWEGTDTKNNRLEPGMYFYVFKEKSSGRELKNYIQIVK